MYKQNPIQQTSIRQNASYEGETIEMKISRMINNKEPLKDPGVELIYTERKEGILAAYDIRADRFEIAVEAMDKVAQSYATRREQRIGEKTYDTMTPEQQQKFNAKFPKNKHAIQAALTATLNKNNEGKA